MSALPVPAPLEEKTPVGKTSLQRRGLLPDPGLLSVAFCLSDKWCHYGHDAGFA